MFVHMYVWEKNAAVKLAVSLYILLFEGKMTYFHWKCIKEDHRHQLLDSNLQLPAEVNNILYILYKHTLWPEINEVLDITKISSVPIPLYKVKHQVADTG